MIAIVRVEEIGRYTVKFLIVLLVFLLVVFFMPLYFRFRLFMLMRQNVVYIVVLKVVPGYTTLPSGYFSFNCI